MPYDPLHSNHPDAVALDDAHVLCRYMDLAGLASLLLTRQLKVTPISEMQDRTEGRWYSCITHPENRITIDFLRRLTAISCWSATPHEEIAMWESFTEGPYGILLRTTVGDLKASFAATPYTVYLSQVTYHDHPPVDPVPVSQALAMKSSAFAYQNELRVVTKEGWHKLTSLVSKYRLDADGSPFNTMSSIELCMLDVDVENLVSEIVVSPYADRVLVELVQTLLGKANMSSVPVRESCYSDLFG